MYLCSPGMATPYKCQQSGCVKNQDGIVGLIIREQRRGRRKQGSASTRKRQVDKLSFMVIFSIFHGNIFHCNQDKTKQKKQNASVSQRDASTFIKTYSKCEEVANEGCQYPYPPYIENQLFPPGLGKSRKLLVFFLFFFFENFQF